MFECEKCNKTFPTERGLSGHKSVHNEGGRYKVSRKINTTTYTCKLCSSSFPYSSSSTNTFCSLECSKNYKRLANNNLIESGVIFSHETMKRYLIETRGNKCECCGIEESWNGKPLAMRQDHIDGNSDNNALENLRLLCPNCHSQTETYGSKGKGNRYKKITKRNQYLQDYKNLRVVGVSNASRLQT